MDERNLFLTNRETNIRPILWSLDLHRVNSTNELLISLDTFDTSSETELKYNFDRSNIDTEYLVHRGDSCNNVKNYLDQLGKEIFTFKHFSRFVRIRSFEWSMEDNFWIAEELRNVYFFLKGLDNYFLIFFFYFEVKLDMIIIILLIDISFWNKIYQETFESINCAIILLQQREI